jgi:organic radical activating enzyme
MNKSSGRKFVVFTGGEPILQLDQALIDELHFIGFEVAVETNGTLSLPNKLDWVCVSPKLGSELAVKQADEIKFVVPQLDNESLIEEQLKRFEKMNFKHFFLQAKDDLNQANNLALAISLCKKRPLWRLSIQTHKLLGID